MSTTFEFTKLADIEKIESVGEGATVLVESEGAVRRIDKDTLIPEAKLPEDHLTYSPQELTEEQKAQARANIGAGEPVTLPDPVAAVQYDVPQELTQEQQEQARQNIGAISAEDIPEMPAPVQADWGENDETSAAFVKGRTHYEVSQEINIDFDGTVSSEPSFSVDTGEGYATKYYLLSAGNYSLESFNQAKVYDPDGEEVTSKKYYDGFDGAVRSFRFALNEDGWTWMCLFDGKTSIGEFVPKAGIYTKVGDGTSLGAFRAYAEGEVKPLDPKFLAETTPTAHQQLVTDADGKAVWEERLAYVKSVTASKGEQIYSYTGMGTAGEPDGTSNRFELLEGNKYYLSGKVMDMSGVPNVTLDGAYTAQATSNGTVYIGNPALLSSANEDNGLVWCITGGYWYFKHTCSYDIKVAHIEYAEDIHPLDEKFIPDTIARVTDVQGGSAEPFVVTIELSSTSGVYYADKTGAEIEEAFKSGKLVYAVVDYKTLSLACVRNNMYGDGPKCAFIDAGVDSLTGEFDIKVWCVYTSNGENFATSMTLATATPTGP